MILKKKGKELVHCQLGQRFTLIVHSKVSVTPNTPADAKANRLVTMRNFPGAGPSFRGGTSPELAVHDQPRVTGTQWEHGVPFYSISGWDGFHEWFTFDVHQGETTHLAVEFREDIYFATGMLWDTAMTPLAVITPTPEADKDGVRAFHFNWLAPRTVRNAIIDCLETPLLTDVNATHTIATGCVLCLRADLRRAGRAFWQLLRGVLLRLGGQVCHPGQFSMEES